MATTSSIKADYSDGRTSPSRSDSPSENSHSPLPTSNTTNNPHRHPGQHLDGEFRHDMSPDRIEKQIINHHL